MSKMTVEQAEKCIEQHDEWMERNGHKGLLLAYRTLAAAYRKKAKRCEELEAMLPKDPNGNPVDRGFICGLSTHSKPKEVALTLGTKGPPMQSLKYGLDHTVYPTSEAALAAQPKEQDQVCENPNGISPLSKDSPIGKSITPEQLRRASEANPYDCGRRK